MPPKTLLLAPLSSAKPATSQSMQDPTPGESNGSISPSHNLGDIPYDANGACSSPWLSESRYIRDYIPPLPDNEVGRKYVVIRGTQPGIYSHWYTFQQQIYRIPYSLGVSVSDSRRAWGIYESNRLAGKIVHLPPRPISPPPAPIGVVPLANPWPNAEGFVVYRGTKPGPYKTWDECRQHIVSCSNPEYVAAATYSEAVFLHIKAELSGCTQQLDLLP